MTPEISRSFTPNWNIHIKRSTKDVLQSLVPTLNKPHLPVALVILKTLISLFRCVWLGLKLNSAGQQPSRTDVTYPWSRICTLSSGVRSCLLSHGESDHVCSLMGNWLVISQWSCDEVWCYEYSWYGYYRAVVPNLGGRQSSQRGRGSRYTLR